MYNDFFEALERQEIHRIDMEEEDVLYREFSYCTASANHRHEVDYYEVSAGTVGKCVYCGRAFRDIDITYAARGPEGAQGRAE